VLSFYSRYYESVTVVDGLKSKWFMEDQALGAIQRNVKGR